MSPSYPSPQSASKEIVLNPIRWEASEVLEEIRLKDEERRREIMDKAGCSPCEASAADPTCFKTCKPYQAKERAVVIRIL